MNVLVICAHPDDEVLGMEGTIAKHASKGDKVFLSVMTDGSAVNHTLRKLDFVKKRQKECVQASRILGVFDVKFHNLPDADLERIPRVELNKILENEVEKIKPRIVYTHHQSDLNKDHKLIYYATRISTRKSVREVYCYEILTVTQSFHPNRYVDITKEMAKKMNAIKCYKTILKNFPDPLSTKAIEGLARQRGIEVRLSAAEAFECIKSVWV